MTEEAKQSVGTVLKERREELKLSLKEAENATSIRLNYLHALEENELHKLISPVYAQGFLKQYANFLEMDAEKTARDYQEFFQRPSHDPEFAYGIGTLEMREHPGSSVKWVPNAVWIAAFLAVIGTAWYLSKWFEVL